MNCNNDLSSTSDGILNEHWELLLFILFIGSIFTFKISFTSKEVVSLITYENIKHFKIF